MKTILPGYSTVRDVAADLDVTGGRVRQLLMEMRANGRDPGVVVGGVRLFRPRDVAMIRTHYGRKQSRAKPAS